MRDMIINKIKEVAFINYGCINEDGEYVDFCKGDEEYVLDNEDVGKLADEIIKLLKK